jgi:hypothetical protein
MTKNVGGVDRVLRIIVGLVLISLVWLVPTNWGWLGLIPLATGLFGFCAAYTLFGINTCSVDRKV